MANRYQILLKRNLDHSECSKGGRHKWGIDGAHSNEYCKKCFVDKPAPEQSKDGCVINNNNRNISFFKPEENEIKEL